MSLVSSLRLTAAQRYATAVRLSPAGLLTVALTAQGAAPDPWQLEVVGSGARRLVVVSARQLGKGSCAAAIATHLAAFTPGSTALIVSASERQARIVLERIRGMLPFLGEPARGVEDTQTEVRWPSGSRIIVLPASSNSLRGWTAHLLLVDEAAYVPRVSWEAVVPTIASTGGRIVCLTSAGAPSGWLHEIWSRPDIYPEWQRHKVTAYDVPRIDREFLATERRRLPSASFAREYLCEFTGAEDSLFDPDAIARAFADRDTEGTSDDFDLTPILLGGDDGGAA